jgi:hypothetical protein
MPSELFHMGAIASSAIGACCIVARRPRGRVAMRAGELAMSLLMLAAMIDVSLLHVVVAPVWWSMLITAVALISILGRLRTPRGRPRAMAGLDAMGAIAMAGLMLVMGVAPSADSLSAGGHHAAGPSSTFPWLLAAAGAIYAGFAFAVAAREPHANTVGRIAPAASGAAVLLMAGAAIAA